jgi:hypothetical protein
MVGRVQGADSARRKQADRLAQVAISDQVPIAADRGEMRRVDDTPVGLVARRRPVNQPQLPSLLRRFGQTAKALGVTRVGGLMPE